MTKNYVSAITEGTSQCALEAAGDTYDGVTLISLEYVDHSLRQYREHIIFRAIGKTDEGDYYQWTLYMSAQGDWDGNSYSASDIIPVEPYSTSVQAVRYRPKLVRKPTTVEMNPQSATVGEDDL